MIQRVISIPDKFRVFKLTASSMVFPNVISRVFLEHNMADTVIEDIINSELPLGLAVMARPGGASSDKISDKLYDIGIVVSLDVDQEDYSILFTGLYRAKILAWERISDNKGGYLVARVEKLNDRSDESFVEENNKLVLSDIKDNKAVFKLALAALKKDLRILCKISHEADSENLNIILDNIENYDLNQKAGIDQLIWDILSAIPDANPEDKQVILSSTRTMERLVITTVLLAGNITIAMIGNKYEEAANMRRGRTNNRANKGGLVKKDDNFVQGAHPEIVKRWERCQKIKDTLHPHALKAIVEDVERLKNSQPGQSEWNIFINHLDCLLDIYSVALTPQEKDISKVEKALAQSLGYPILISLSQEIEANKKSYYLNLERAQKSNEITEWIKYFLEMINASTVRTKSQLTFILEKSRFFDRFKNELNQRQKKVINRMLEEGHLGFKGGMTARKYIAITKCSKATATRDLTELLTRQAIKRLPGKGRNISYELVLH